MKKLLFIVTLSFTILLSSCTLPITTDTIDTTDEEETVTTALTEEELTELIEELMPEVEATTSYDLVTFQDDVTAMVAEARDAVIGVITLTEDGYGTGSGVIYKSVDDLYYVVTNHHVVEDGIEYTIVFERNGLLFEVNADYVTLLGSDETTDLAVLTFESTIEFPTITMADSYDIELGQFVFAIGNPLGFEYYGTVTMGVVSGLTRFVTDEEFEATLLQHDAAISPGNSGGALLDINGELIGINNMKLTDDYVSNIGFAIPSNTVKRIVEDLEDDGEVARPYLGITASSNTNSCGMDYGVCVTVLEDGAAEAAGLEDYDVIVGYKNAEAEEYMEIYNFNDLKEAILNSSIGESIQIQYYRNGVLKESLVTELHVHPDDE